MDSSRVIIGGVLSLSFLAGVSFIQQAFVEKKRIDKRLSKMRKFSKEIQFRLRLAAGIGLLLWVMTGLVWLAIHW